jgi:hypothetical protein
MSGLKDTSILYPEFLNEKSIVHFPINFQANSKIERAMAIIENEGLLSIKAHIVPQIANYVAIDGVTDLYMSFLDLLLNEIKSRYGQDIWFTSMGEMTNFIFKNN